MTPVKTNKLLGLHVDNNLSWNVHVTKLCSKLRIRMYLFNVKDKRRVSTVTLFCNLGWLLIDVHIRYFTAIVMYNIVHGFAPAYLTYIFILNSSVHDHHTRGCTNIHVRKYNMSVGQRTFAFRGGKLWDTILYCFF